MSRPPKKLALAIDANLVQDNLPAEVVPKLFIGSLHAAFNQEALVERGITHIVNASRLPASYPKSFTYLSIDIRDKDNANLLSCIPAANIFIEAGMESGGVLVHCCGGRSRSSAFVTAFLMSSRSLTVDQVYPIIRIARPVAAINGGFISQLKAYALAGYDVYGAQQVLLRGRIRVLRENRNNMKQRDFKATFTTINNNNSSSSSGSNVGSATTTSNTSYSASNSNSTSTSSSIAKTLAREMKSPRLPSLLPMSVSVGTNGNGTGNGQKRALCEGYLSGGGSGSCDRRNSGDSDVYEYKSNSASLDYNDYEGSSSSNGNGNGGSSSTRTMVDKIFDSSNSSSITTSSSSNNNSKPARTVVSNVGDTVRRTPIARSTSMSMSMDVNGATDNMSKDEDDGEDNNNNGNDDIINAGPVASNKSKNKSSTAFSIETRAPNIRLSRPGSGSVRVIPPVRGLEQTYCCDWCATPLFCLANVLGLRADPLTTPLSIPLSMGGDGAQSQSLLQSSSLSSSHLSLSQSLSFSDVSPTKTILNRTSSPIFDKPFRNSNISTSNISLNKSHSGGSGGGGSVINWNDRSVRRGPESPHHGSSIHGNRLGTGMSGGGVMPPPSTRARGSKAFDFEDIEMSHSEPRDSISLSGGLGLSSGDELSVLSRRCSSLSNTKLKSLSFNVSTESSTTAIITDGDGDVIMRASSAGHESPSPRRDDANNGALSPSWHSAVAGRSNGGHFPSSTSSMHHTNSHNHNHSSSLVHTSVVSHLLDVNGGESASSSSSSPTVGRSPSVMSIEEEKEHLSASTPILTQNHHQQHQQQLWLGNTNVNGNGSNSSSNSMTSSTGNAISLPPVRCKSTPTPSTSQYQSQRNSGSFNAIDVLSSHDSIIINNTDTQSRDTVTITAPAVTVAFATVVLPPGGRSPVLDPVPSRSHHPLRNHTAPSLVVNNSAMASPVSRNGLLKMGSFSALTSGEESPRIPVPPGRYRDQVLATGSTHSYSNSPPSVVLQSAEKRRWLARFGLLKSEGDAKVTQLAQQDEDVSQNITGDSSYIHIEYLDWMGEEPLSSDADRGAVMCGNCKTVIGTWFWNPTPRQSHNGMLEAPVFRVSKHSVREVGISLDATPRQQTDSDGDGDGTVGNNK